MVNPRDHAIQVEMVKTGSTQNKDGTYVRFALNLVDSGAAELMASHVGTRYMCVLVQLNDQDEPTSNRDTTLLPQSHMLPRESAFQAFLIERGYTENWGEDAAVQAVYKFCRIGSRAELTTNKEAAERWKQLKRDFEMSLKL